MNQLTEQDLPAVLPTDRAGAYINRSPQTLRKWACLDCAPMGIRPIVSCCNAPTRRLGQHVQNIHRPTVKGIL